MEKKISAIICTYNGEKYIEEVLMSIYNQKGYEEYIEEIIVVDNASKDSTKNIVMKMKEKIGNIQYVYEPKAGLANARKHVGKVKTEWTVFFDDDNVLCENWLINTIEYISKNPKLGVVNTNSVAKPDFPMNEKKHAVLKALLPSIACTHVNLEELEAGVQSAIGSPFGAGMCLKSEPVKEMLNDGWTKNVGRKGDNLGSGEDGEIARYVLDKGFEYGFNNKSTFFHYIPEKRIQPEYIIGLRKGLAKGTYMFLSNDNKYILKRIKLFLISCKTIVVFPFKYVCEKEGWKRVEAEMSFTSSRYFIGYILKDFFILKRNVD